MPRRALHWLVLCFTVLWYGVLVPGHNRGQIVLPGGGGAADSRIAHRCCPADGTRPGQRNDPRHHDRERPTGPCAVCFFIAGIDLPPPVTVISARLGLAGVRDLPAPHEPLAARPLLPFHSRGPPQA
jgi:hypothetical protein